MQWDEVKLEHQVKYVRRWGDRIVCDFAVVYDFCLQQTFKLENHLVNAILTHVRTVRFSTAHFHIHWIKGHTTHRSYSPKLQDWKP